MKRLLDSFLSRLFRLLAYSAFLGLVGFLPSSLAWTSSMDSTTTVSALSFVTDICGLLKEQKRTGWVMRSVPFPESDSDHMHRCAMCALLVSQPADPSDDYTHCPNYHPQQVDTVKLLKMAVTHDLCEALAGDITPYCGVSHSDKHDRERQSMEKIRNVVGDPLGEDLFQLWMEYEQQQTVEAIYCKDIDKFEMVVQAYEYEKKHLQHCPPGTSPQQDDSATSKDYGSPTVVEQPLRRFFQSTRSVLRTPLFRRLDQELRERRSAMLQEKGWAMNQNEWQQYEETIDK